MEFFSKSTQLGNGLSEELQEELGPPASTEKLSVSACDCNPSTGELRQEEHPCGGLDGRSVLSNLQVPG